MKVNKVMAVIAVSLMGALAAPSYAGERYPGYSDEHLGEYRSDRHDDHQSRGERINERLDNKGERINDEYERAADDATINGDERKARELEKEGDRIEQAYDKKGDRAQAEYERDRKKNRY